MEAGMNHKFLPSLQDRRPYDGGVVGGTCLVAGSSAEGLAIEKGWGHPEADKDTMDLLGGLVGVHVPQGRQPPGRAVLRYKPEGCPPAYCKLEVTDVQALLRLKVDARCIYRSGGVNWLHTKNLLKQIRRGHSISGPAGQFHGGLQEYIPALVCSDAHPEIVQKYVTRPRHGWPSRQQLETIRELRMLLVLTGHKQSNDFPLQARLSWSPSEVVLINELPEYIKQGYIAIKYAFKYFIKRFRDPKIAGDGRSLVGSYHLKTTFLHHLERKTPTMIGSQLGLTFGLLYDLDDYLNKGKLPQYFLPDCNLLATVGPEERHTARSVINHILSDPLRAILTCPTNPQDIYGDVLPDALVAAFHRVSSCRTSVESREELLMLLNCVDERRQWQYQRQQQEDEKWTRTMLNRPELAGLVDMLLELIQ